MIPDSKSSAQQNQMRTVRVSIREHLLREIEVGKRAQEALQVFDNNPVIQEFLTKIEQLQTKQTQG